MKISKVNHTKSGVGVCGQQTRGILYVNPNQTSESHINLEKHVENLNKKAQMLYSIFVAASSGAPAKRKKYYNEIKRFAKEQFKGQILNAYDEKASIEQNISFQMKNLNRWMENSLQNGNNVKRYPSFRDIKSEDIEYVVDESLRKSLRKCVKLMETNTDIFFPDLIKKFLKIVIKTELEKPEPLTSEEKEILLRVLDEDFGKSGQLKQIVHSIESQNVRVNSVEKDGRVLLQLANADHKKKGQVFTFLKKFASAKSETERENMLLHFKQLVLLFYCGKDKYEETFESAVPVWSWGMFEEEAAVNFDDEVCELINERQSLGKGKEYRKRKKSIEESIRRKLREKIAMSYRQAVIVEGITSEDIYWLQYIENNAEKILLGKWELNPVRLSVSYLCEHTYREWVSYICGKYIDMGKGVYHFAAPEDLRKVISGEETIGEVLPEYRNNITSFDYERIKAEETLNRDISLYISFAVNNFAMSVMSRESRKKKGNEDILGLEENKIREGMYHDADRRILRFFGGKSTWKNGELDGISTIDMVLALKDSLSVVRNSNFHYTSVMSEKFRESSNDVLNKIFDKEFAEAGRLYREKYFSNNVWMFYSKQDVLSLLDTLYSSEKERPAQVPAYGKIINKANMNEMLNSFIKGKKMKKLMSGDNSLERMEKFRNCLFFVLKEIYYYGFLQEKNVREYFFDAVETDRKNTSQDGTDNSKNKDNHNAAHENFKGFLYALTENKKDISFGEICQQIMTDYNQQNQGRHTITYNRNGHDHEKYKHFRTLLYLYLKQAFIQYLKDNECYSFLREPESREMQIKSITVESFCAGWRPHLYDNLKQETKQERVLLSWYIMAHFLNQKQLNMLIGCIKNYIQYIQDIDCRCAETDNRKGKDTKQRVITYNQILEILEFSKLYCGNITKCFEDYFEDEEAYARHLADYVELGLKGERASVSLKAFCGQEIRQGSQVETIGLYHDGMNPILNRNIVYASMYGNEKLLCNCFQKVSEKQIRMYYKKRNELAEVFKSGICKNIEQEKSLRDFQNLKNHIELTEIMTYSEIVNDFMGQLISWAYLRERDLMYYQLGFHYMRLFYSDCVEADSFLRQLRGEGICMRDGAVLYQIIAMYTYNLPVIVRDRENGRTSEKKDVAANGPSVYAFYKGYCQDQGEIYELGLCLFENVKKEHDEMVEFRNYIDHFKYYSHMDRSILELYSDIYDRFFTYDLKLRKSVSFILKNILLRYFVIAETEMQLGESVRYKASEIKEKAVRYTIKYLESDELQVSKNNVEKQKNRKVTIPARDDNFLEQLKRILEYKESVQ